MKAAVYKGKQRLEVEEIPTPEPGAGEVVLKVKHCAICGTDVHAFLYDVAEPGTVMGHEYSGVISAVGPGVTRWREGDRVIGGGPPPPGVHFPLRQEPRFNFPKRGYASERRRGYAQYVLMPEWEPLAIPDGVSDQDAALAEPLAVAVRAVRRSAMKVGDLVTVLGAGPIGLMCVAAARAAGAGKVFVSEPTEARRQAALEMGADEVVDPTSEDVIERMVALTAGHGPDVVFEAAAAKPTLDQALNMVRRCGQVMLVAIAWEPVAVLPAEWMAREVGLNTTFSTDEVDWRTALGLIASGKADIQPMVNQASFVPMDDIQQAFEALVVPTTQLQMVVNPWD